MSNHPQPRRWHTAAALALMTALSLLLSACSSGSDEDNTRYPLRTAYENLVFNGEVATYNVSGDCNGSSSTNDSAAVATVFQGVPGYSSQSTSAVSFSNCTPATSTSSTTTYYDNSLRPLALVDGDGTYTEFTTSSLLPDSAQVGDRGTYATANLYADTTRAVRLGRNEYTWTIEYDTLSSAILNLTMRSFDTGGQLLLTQQLRQRLRSSGSLSTVSIDAQYTAASSSGALRVVFSRR